MDKATQGTGAGGGGALTAISAAKAGVPINAMAAIAVASLFMATPRSIKGYHAGLPGAVGGDFQSAHWDWPTLNLPVRPRLYRRKRHSGVGRFRRILCSFQS
jgi:hypothetical protein